MDAGLCNIGTRERRDLVLCNSELFPTKFDVLPIGAQGLATDTTDVAGKWFVIKERWVNATGVNTTGVRGSSRIIGFDVHMLALSYT
jgi:hypothetical protein